MDISDNTWAIFGSFGDLVADRPEDWRRGGFGRFESCGEATGGRGTLSDSFPDSAVPVLESEHPSSLSSVVFLIFVVNQWLMYDVPSAKFCISSLRGLEGIPLRNREGVREATHVRGPLERSLPSCVAVPFRSESPWRESEGTG